jgi:hypothetical protein
MCTGIGLRSFAYLTQHVFVLHMKIWYCVANRITVNITLNKRSIFRLYLSLLQKISNKSFYTWMIYVMPMLLCRVLTPDRLIDTETCCLHLQGLWGRVEYRVSLRLSVSRSVWEGGCVICQQSCSSSRLYCICIFTHILQTQVLRLLSTYYFACSMCSAIETPRLCTADYLLSDVAFDVTAALSCKRSTAWPAPSLSLLHFLCRALPCPVFRLFSWFCMASAGRMHRFVIKSSLTESRHMQIADKCLGSYQWCVDLVLWVLQL